MKRIGLHIKIFFSAFDIDINKFIKTFLFVVGILFTIILVLITSYYLTKFAQQYINNTIRENSNLPMMMPYLSKYFNHFLISASLLTANILFIKKHLHNKKVKALLFSFFCSFHVIMMSLVINTSIKNGASYLDKEFDQSIVIIFIFSVTMYSVQAMNIVIGKIKKEARSIYQTGYDKLSAHQKLDLEHQRTKKANSLMKT